MLALKMEVNMKNITLSVLAILALCLLAGGKNPEQKFGLPPLHSIKDVSLSPAYSCRSAEEFSMGYGSTALFLSDYSKQRNSPDLVFNGACGSEDYFDVATAGDDMSLIADLGANISLEEISASRAFNLERVHAFSAYTLFARVVKVKVNHAYAVLINENDKRGLFVFTVTEHEPNKRVSLRYAVKSYQVKRGVEESSPGFGWEEKNSL
jgi:hypothetical protein